MNKNEMRLIIPIIVIILVSVIVPIIINFNIILNLDKSVSILFESLRNILLDYLFISISIVSNSFIIFFFLATIFVWKKNRKRWIIPLFFSFIVSWIYCFILKLIVKRPRPFEDEVVQIFIITFNYMKNNFSTWNTSFPSMHACLVFCAVPIIFKEYKKFAGIWLIFAIMVALSRVYFGAHYFLDVITGAVIGLSIGYIFVILEEKYELGNKLIKKLFLRKKNN